MKLDMKEGFLVKTMTNGVYGDTWEFKDHHPDYTPEVYDATTKELVPGEVKRIMYVEVQL